MGSTLPKWRIKQKRERLKTLRQAARKAKKSGLLGVPRVAQH
jgi:hypothetical protein